MKTKQIIIILTLLNASAVFVGVSGVGDAIGFEPTVGAGEEIDAVNEEAQEVSTQRSAADEFVGAVIGGVGVITSIFSLAFAGPRMFINLGAPAALVAVFAAPLYVVVGLDVIEFLTGRAT